MLASPSRRFRLGALLALWVAALLATRVAVTGSPFGLFLVWNLVLAAVPLAASTALVRLDARGGRARSMVGLGVVWLLFLPNAPYILTDLVHLAHRPPVPFWFDLALLLSAGGLGLLSGYVALADVQGVVARRIGSRAAWAGSVGVLFLSAFGIYLGRELRWNSWDVLTAPGTLAADVLARIADPLAHPTTVVMTLVFGGMLTVGYVALHELARPHPTAPQPPRLDA